MKKFTALPLLFLSLLICIVAHAETLEEIPQDFSVTSPALSGTASLNQSTVAIGTPVTATYQFINSNGEDELILAYWNIYVGDTVYEKRVDLSSMSGTLTFTPTFGDYLNFNVYAEDSENSYGYHTDTIPITGNPQADPVSITAAYTPETITKGDTINVTYSINNGVAPYTVSVFAASWSLRDQFIDTLYIENMPATGSFTFTPNSGDYVFLFIDVIDAQGFYTDFYYDYLYLHDPTRMPGDADNDGRTDIHDALLIMQYTAGWNVVINFKQADVTADSLVTLSDALLILQSASEMNVTLK